MTITLFGGVILIALIYFALRLAGVSNYWRGVISGLLPTLGMLIYSMSHAMGGDAVTLHIAVYVATATVLTLGGSAKKVVGQRLHWIPALFIAFFVGLAVLMALFLNIAMHGLPPSVASVFMPNAKGKVVHTAFSGEVPHDSEAAKTISQYLKKTEQQRQLGWQIEVVGLDGLFLSQGRDVIVSVRDKAGQPLEGAQVSLQLKRPATLSGEQTDKMFALDAPSGVGSYRGVVRLNEPGLWVAFLQITHGQDKYETAREVLVSATR